MIRAPLPEGAKSGPDADEVARRLEASVNKEAWDRVGAVAWTQRGRSHLWDRRRGFDRVQLRDTVVLLDVHSKRGTATREGVPLSGKELEDALQHAYAGFINDSFWLN